MDVYEQLGVRPVINCATTYTRLGGSIMPPQWRRRWPRRRAASSTSSTSRRRSAAARRVTRNEAAYVSNGAAAGLALAAAACMTGEDVALMARLPNQTEGMKNEIVVHRDQRNWYDIAVRQVGVKLVEIGHAMETRPGSSTRRSPSGRRRSSTSPATTSTATPCRCRTSSSGPTPAACR